MLFCMKVQNNRIRWLSSYGDVFVLISNANSVTCLPNWMLCYL